MIVKTVMAFSLVATLLLSGCQSSQQSMNSAYVTCDRAGLRLGTYDYQRCTQGVYEENRQKANQAASAVAVGVAAGAIGAYAISEAAKKKTNKDRDQYSAHRPRRFYDNNGRTVSPVYGARSGW